MATTQATSGVANTIPATELWIPNPSIPTQTALALTNMTPIAIHTKVAFQNRMDHIMYVRFATLVWHNAQNNVQNSGWIWSNAVIIVVIFG